MSAVTVQLDYLRQQIHKNEFVKKYADLIEEKTNVHIEYIVCGLSIIPLIMVYYGYFGRTISDLVGFLYPVYATIQAVEAKADGEFWLTYWIVYSFFDIIEEFLDFLLYWIPFYYPIKILFFLWLYLPQTAGARIIYKMAVAPAFKAINDSFGTA